MNIENIKDLLDEGFVIQNQFATMPLEMFRKTSDGYYRFFKAYSIGEEIIIMEKDWNVFLEKVKKEMEDK